MMLTLHKAPQPHACAPVQPPAYNTWLTALCCVFILSGNMFLAVCTHSYFSVLCAAATAATAAAAAVAVSLQGQIHQGADTDGEKQGCPRLTAPKRSAELFLQSERLARQYYPDDSNPNNALRCEWGPCCVAGGGG